LLIDYQDAPTKTETLDCLRDLCLTDPHEDKNALKRRKGNRATGTCEWIISTEELTSWLGSGREDILWLYGYPGTGKTTMAIFLTEELLTAFSRTDGETLAYFFCDSGDQKRKTATSVVRGLLLQLIQQHPQLLDYLLPKYHSRGRELFESFDALWPIFIAAAADQNTGRKYCIVDAVDECDRESQDTLLRQFEETFSSLTNSNLRILVTSRPYPEIEVYLKIFANKDLASYPQRTRDIERYIEEKVVNLAQRQSYTDKVRKKVSNLLREKAGGTFLWIGLVCEKLDGTPSKDAVHVLMNIPKGLDSLYKELLDTALQREVARVDVIRILRSVAFSLRPLSVLELSEACQLHLDEEDVETREQFTREEIASCRLMVIIQDEEVLLLHQSVRDYLERAGYFSKLEAHADLAYRCVDLLIEEFHSSELSVIHFSLYAAQNWPNHARMAESKYVVKDSQLEFFDIDSPCREQWLNRLRSRDDSFLNEIPSNFSILHIAARWGLSTLARYVYHKAGEMTYFDISNRINSDGVTPLELAAQSQYPDTVYALLDLGGKSTTRALEAAAGNVWNGEEVMKLLLDRHGDRITITKKMVDAAAGNWKGNGVMALLLNRRGDQITITDEAVSSIAGKFDKEVMVLLLNCQGDKITITEGVVRAAAGNMSNGEGVMKILLDRLGDQITITKELVTVTAENWWNGDEVMKLLLDRRGDQITITDETVSSIAGRFDEEVMALLLARQGDKITITEKVLKATAENVFHGKRVITLLLDRRGDQITITDEAMSSIAGRFDEEVMALLLARQGDKITITEKVLKATAENVFHGKRVMKLLLGHRGDQIAITEEIVNAAAKNWRNSEGVMTLLLDHPGDQITITDEAVSSIAEMFGETVMALLLSHRGDQITITEEVLKAAARNKENGEGVMTLLLDHRGDQITITEEVVTAAAGNWRSGEGVMTLLLDHPGDQITITDEAVSSIAGRLSETVMILLLSRRGDQITITDAALSSIAGKFDKEVMALLLNCQGDKITITEEVLKAAAGNMSNGEGVVTLFLDRLGDQITITEEVVKAAAGNISNGKGVMKILLDRRGDQITITEEILKTAAGNMWSGKWVMTLLLNYQGDQITITEGVVRAAAGNMSNGKGLMKILLDRRGDQINITDDAYEALLEGLVEK
jgi:CMP-2-keto-3-deoxyoctulosonic acid synthetase/DNA polymerase III delta prime subunit